MAAPSAWDVGTLDFCGELQARGPGSGSGLVMGIARGGVETAAAAEPDDELQWAVPESWTPWQAVSVPSAYATVSSRSDSWGQGTAQTPSWYKQTTFPRRSRVSRARIF